jgi:ATP-binding cassette subfamily B protein
MNITQKNFMVLIMNISHLYSTFIYVWRKNKTWVILSVLISVITGFIPLFQLWISKELVNQVSNLIINKSQNYIITLVLLLFEFILISLDSLLKKSQDYFDNKVQILLDHDLKKNIAEKSITVPYGYFDIPDFYNHLNRVNGSPGTRFLAPLRDLLDIGSSLINVISYFAFLVSINWILLVLSIIASFPVFLIQFRFGKILFDLLVKQTPYKREANYFEFLLSNREAAKEIRLFNISSYILKRWSNLYMKNSLESLHVLKRRKISEFSLDVFTAFLYSLSAVIILKLIGNHTISIGEFVAVGQAVGGLQSSMNQMSNTLAKMFENNFYVKDYYKFIDFNEESIKSEDGNLRFPSPIKRGIEFKNVCFHYPKNNKYILKNINLTIKSGEKIAIVGENGSGKSTLIKCLLGLYKPTEGSIFFDDIDITMIDKADLHKNITAIFQDFMRYSLTVRENIAFGDIENINNINKIEQTAKKTKIDSLIESFDKGYETYLGRFIYDGVELSGGQWQKIALARTIFRNSQVLIFDEPTSSLDPEAELEVFNQFKRFTTNKTAIFISHRMSAAKMADRIIVMKEGRIVEIGTHDELIKLCGEYERLFRKQAQWYFS